MTQIMNDTNITTEVQSMRSSTSSAPSPVVNDMSSSGDTTTTMRRSGSGGTDDRDDIPSSNGDNSSVSLENNVTTINNNNDIKMGDTIAVRSCTQIPKGDDDESSSSILKQILDRLHREKIAFDSDLYIGYREPWQFVDIQQVIPDSNIHMFMLRRFLKVCLQGVKLYLPIHLLPILLFKRQKLVKEPGTILLNLAKAQTKSSVFMASFTGSFLYILCLFNRMGFADRPFIVYLAGFCCGLSCLFEPRSRRKELTIYCFTRAAEIMQQFGFVRNYWTPATVDYFSVLLFCGAMGGLMYYYHREPKYIKAFVRTIMRFLLGY